MGISSAVNDMDSGILHIQTYAATPSQTGRETTFRIVNLPCVSTVKVERDGVLYANWKSSDSTSIVVGTDIGDHSFIVHTKSLDKENAWQLHLVLRMRQ